MKKAAFIISFKGFKDPEYFIPKNILESSGIKVATVSTEKGVAFGDDGGEASVDFNLEELAIKEYDAVFFVGGPGMAENLDNEGFLNLAKKAFEKGKIVSAICIAPAMLAKSGVLKGKKATVWHSALNKQGIAALKEGGAFFQEKTTVEDGNILTACGPEAAEEFGKALAKKILG